MAAVLPVVDTSECSCPEIKLIYAFFFLERERVARFSHGVCCCCYNTGIVAESLVKFLQCVPFSKSKSSSLVR